MSLTFAAHSMRRPVQLIPGRCSSCKSAATFTVHSAPFCTDHAAAEALRSGRATLIRIKEKP